MSIKILVFMICFILYACFILLFALFHRISHIQFFLFESKQSKFTHILLNPKLRLCGGFIGAGQAHYNSFQLLYLRLNYRFIIAMLCTRPKGFH